MKMEVDERGETAGDRAMIRAGRRRLYYTKLVGFLTLLLVILITILVFLFLRKVPIGQSAVKMEVVNIDKFKAEFDSSVDPIIFDIREKHFYDASHLPGAEWGEKKRCLEYGVDTCERKGCLEKNEYFFYSDHGEEYHEVQNAIKRTSSRGCWSEVWLLDGGIQDWIEAGYELES